MSVPGRKSKAVKPKPRGQQQQPDNLAESVLITTTRSMTKNQPRDQSRRFSDVKVKANEGACKTTSATAWQSTGVGKDVKPRKQSLIKAAGSHSDLNEVKLTSSTTSSSTRTPRPAKTYSSSKLNDTRTPSTSETSDIGKQQQTFNSLQERRRSHLKTPPRVPLIVCDHFPENAADNNEQDNEYADGRTSYGYLDEYSRRASDTGKGRDISSLEDQPFRTSSAKSNHRDNYHVLESRTECHRKTVSHWGSFELSSDDEESGNDSRERTQFPTQLKKQSSSSFKIPQTLKEKEIGEDVTDADFESDEDIDTKATDNDIKTLYERACRLVGVVSSKRIERELLGDRVYLDYAGLLTDDVKAICIALLNNTTVTRLDLSGNNVCQQAAQYISELINENHFITHLLREGAIDGILSSVTSSKNIQVLDLSENKLQDEHLKEIALLLSDNKHIQELRLRSCDIDAEGGNILAPVLAKTTIEKLDLSWNQLRQKGGAAFCLALGDNKSIRELDLSWNGLGREGCVALEVALATNKTLIQLNLECNRIASECLAHLLKGLARNTTLESIILTKNPISVEDAKMITSAVKNMTNSALKVFDISDVTVDNDFVNGAEQLQKDRQISIYHGNLLQRPDKEMHRDNRTLSSFDPILVLFEYMKQQNLRLIDLFRNLDVNHDNAISKEELRNGFLSLKMKLPEGVLSAAFHKLDLNSNNQIDIDELKNAHRRVLRQTASLMARSNTRDGDESYGDLLHEFQNLVRMATMFRRKPKSTSEDQTSPRSKTPRDRLSSTSSLAPEHSKSRRPSARSMSGRKSFSNNLEPSRSPQRTPLETTSQRRPTMSDRRGRTLSASSRGSRSSKSGSDRSISPSSGL